MARTRTRRRDVNLKRIKREMAKIQRSPHVRIGFPREAPTTKAKRDVEGFKPLTNLQIAVFHEFGTQTIPERSFIRSTYRENIRKIRSTVRRLLKGVIKGTETTSSALTKLGLMHVAQIQKKVRSNIPPPLKRRKGTALIDTAQMINSVVFVKKL